MLEPIFLISTFKIPFSPVVTYSNGEKGGSFEESFSQDCFIKASFKAQAIDSKLVGKESDFRNIFNPSKPWVAQLANFISVNGGNPGSINKVEIAENMAASCSPIPKTFEELATLVSQTRITNPIVHPDDVEVKI